ncbi:hypothetical protein PV11_03630 [Exophiala sideris]|uniref:Uncharacterized protein n=1 Tax=Exophiala sideris TaxID=1016849 RepID=A0A0D1X1S0_9EURO|nr:hypothetical protein PV11_03630 [Exophiala sideris]
MPATTPKPVNLHLAGTVPIPAAEFLVVVLAATSEVIDVLLEVVPDEVLVAFAAVALVLAGAAVADVEAVLPDMLDVAEATSCA